MALDAKGLEAAREADARCQRESCKVSACNGFLCHAAITAYLSAVSPPDNGEPVCATEGCGKPGTERFERGGVGSHYCTDCMSKIAALQPVPDDGELVGLYEPRIIRYEGEGEPFWQFVERDCGTVVGQPFAATVEKVFDFDGKLIGFTIYDPAAPSHNEGRK